MAFDGTRCISALNKEVGKGCTEKVGAEESKGCRSEQRKEIIQIHKDRI